MKASLQLTNSPSWQWTLVQYTLQLTCPVVTAPAAAGIAVNVVMLSTVFLVGLVMLVAWGTHPLLVLLFLAPFALIEGVFLSANILNIPHGGWFSITLAGRCTHKPATLCFVYDG